MQIFLSYTEIEQYIQNHYQKEIGIMFIDNHTISLSYSAHRFVPTVHITLKIERFTSEELILSYNGKRGINLIIHGIILFMEGKINKSTVEIMPERKEIYLYIDAIKGIEKAYEYLTPKDIFFTEEGMVLEAGVR